MGKAARVAALTLLGLAVLAAAAWWLLLPRHHIQPVRVLGAQADAPAGLIAVTFSVPEDLAALRERAKAGFITASLFACGDPDAQTLEVVSQGDGYYVDQRRVQRIPNAGGSTGGVTYRALFDPRLSRTVEGRAQAIPLAAAEGGLCFALDGGNMFGGRIWSDPIRVTVTR